MIINAKLKIEAHWKEGPWWLLTCEVRSNKGVAAYELSGLRCAVQCMGFCHLELAQNQVAVIAGGGGCLTQ